MLLSGRITIYNNVNRIISGLNAKNLFDNLNIKHSYDVYNLQI